jgi:nitrous oxide reductase
MCRVAKPDDYVMFASAGHGGQVIAIGIPSMRILKVIAVFAPELWQGYGYGVKENALHELYGRGPYPAADTHHPALSETNGEYDGQFLFIGDKANGRVAVIDLRDWETKQIVKNPVFYNNHGAAFVTPNTEYVVEVSQYGLPLGNKYAPIERYKEAVSRADYLLEVRPQEGAHHPGAVLRRRSAALLAGFGGLRQGGKRRLGLCELVQHRDGNRWRGEGQSTL